jgi:hypothetical protein
MDPDTAHTFSESSRNTLITTAIVGKSSQSCHLGWPVDTFLSSTLTHRCPLHEHKAIAYPYFVHDEHQLTPPQAVLSFSLCSCISYIGDEKVLHTPRFYTYLQEVKIRHNSHQHQCEKRSQSTLYTTTFNTPFARRGMSQQQAGLLGCA